MGIATLRVAFLPSFPMHPDGTISHADEREDPSGSPHAPHAPEQRDPRPRLRRWCLVIIPGATLAFGTIMLIALGLADARPHWWREIDPKNEQIAAAALRVENGAATQLTQIRQAADSNQTSAPWTIRISSADANAWLAARLRPWLESQSAEFTWPPELRAVEVRFDGGRIDVGASVGDRAPAAASPVRVITASLRPEFRASGELWLPAASTSVGRLSVPSSWMLSRAAPAAKRAGGKPLPGSIESMPELRDIISALSGDRPMMRTPVIRIGDGRRVRLLQLEPRDDALYITCQTLPRETARAER